MRLEKCLRVVQCHFKCHRITPDVWLTPYLSLTYTPRCLTQKRREKHHSLVLALTLTVTLVPNYPATSHCCWTVVHCTVFNTPTLHKSIPRSSQYHPRIIPGSSQDHPRIIPGSSRYHPSIIPGSSQDNWRQHWTRNVVNEMPWLLEQAWVSPQIMNHSWFWCKA